MKRLFKCQDHCQQGTFNLYLTQLVWFWESLYSIWVILFFQMNASASTYTCALLCVRCGWGLVSENRVDVKIKSNPRGFGCSFEWFNQRDIKSNPRTLACLSPNSQETYSSRANCLCLWSFMYNRSVWAFATAGLMLAVFFLSEG